VNLGLPENEIITALLFFNIGVEIGQLAFIFLIIAVVGSFKKMAFRAPKWSWSMPAYIIGSFASFWFLQRLFIMF
jgi:hypothetical protein